MKKTIAIIFACFLFAASCQAATPVPSPSPEASDSSQIDPQTIKDNIKRRIEQVVKNQQAEAAYKKVAYLGLINSITPNSITIEATDGTINQASTSANTNYIELPKNKAVKREDTSIGDYVAALGFLSKNSEVLDTRRLLILKTPPPPPVKTSAYGLISSIDLKKNRLQLLNPKTNQNLTFSLSSKTESLATNPTGLTNKKIELKDLALNQSALIVFTAPDSSESARPADIILVKHQ